MSTPKTKVDGDLPSSPCGLRRGSGGLARRRLGEGGRAPSNGRKPNAPGGHVPPVAFTLIEVVVAIGIFAIGMVAVVGLFTPVARSVTSSADAEIAARVADALRVKLQSQPFATVAGLLKESAATGHPLAVNDGRADYDITKDAQLIFANRDGSKIGVYADAIWIDPVTKRNSDREKFFEIALVRNEAISPKASTTTDANGAEVTTQPDATAAVLAYTARLRWPAFISDGGTGTIQFGANPTGSVRFDHSKKQVLYVAGSVLR
jgi:type II secretory pathway pseudopilin PulG